MSKSPEFVTFERGAKALIRKIEKYANEGGDHLGAGADIERKALDAKAVEHRRWRIENGLEDPPKNY